LRPAREALFRLSRVVGLLLNLPCRIEQTGNVRGLLLVFDWRAVEPCGCLDVEQRDSFARGLERRWLGRVVVAERQGGGFGLHRSAPQ
jgi:hypothetical protein